MVPWWWCFKTEPDALWRKVINAVHCGKNSCQFIPYRANSSGMWKAIANLENITQGENVNLINLFQGVLGRGDQLHFWLDPWVNSKPLRYILFLPYMH
ncbi:hypothetical protein HanIR_Chr04g0187991 [Helianthus annuus]|nr:hypothetical protein HanIR_Chr04g0187991 [Helianthus annuus]